MCINVLLFIYWITISIKQLLKFYFERLSRCRHFGTIVFQEIIPFLNFDIFFCRDNVHRDFFWQGSRYFRKLFVLRFLFIIRYFIIRFLSLNFYRPIFIMQFPLFDNDTVAARYSHDNPVATRAQIRRWPRIRVTVPPRLQRCTRVACSFQWSKSRDQRRFESASLPRREPQDRDLTAHRNFVRSIIPASIRSATISSIITSTTSATTVLYSMQSRPTIICIYMYAHLELPSTLTADSVAVPT